MNAAFLGVAELGAYYRDRRLTPIEVVRQRLARLEQFGPRLNAFADQMAELVLAEAGRLTAELAAGHDRGPLHGIPVAIKDLIEVEGAPTGYGSRVRPPRIATADAELVRRLRAAGAVIFGKTNLLEYAYGIVHPAIGQTNNPFDTARTSGGSSGGSAAAVAAGIVPLAIGTDTGGSIRIPAAYCGIVGMKPSFGLVPLDGVFPLSPSLDHAGPLSRSVADAALVLAAITGRPMLLAATSVEGLRIGRIRRHFESPELTAGVAEAVGTAMALLQAGGARIIDIDIPELAAVTPNLVTILHPEASVVHKALLAENPGGYAPRTRVQLEAGFAVSAADYLLALDYREKLRRAVDAAFGEVDVLASPSVPFVAPHEDPQIGEGQDGEMLASGFANVTGHPALSLPCGLSEGLPVGLQVVGRLNEDAGLLSAAAAIEAALGFSARPVLGV